jgi:hypothetical protein
MQKLNEIMDAADLADMSNTKQSGRVSKYYLDGVNSQPKTLPMMSYGLQLTRQADAPPTSLIDTESQLKNQFDLLGKSGFVYRKDGSMPNMHSNAQSDTASLPPVESAVTVNDFFLPMSGRDFNNFSKKSCSTTNIWRDDINTRKDAINSLNSRFAHIDTRAQTKDRIDSCSN